LLLDNLYMPIDLGFDFRVNYIIYLLYILYAIISNKKIFLNKNFIVASLFFTFLSLIISVLKGTPILLVLKQTFLIYISFLVSYILINGYKFDLVKIIKDYIQLIFIAGIFGLIQFISQGIGFNLGADFSYLGFDMGYYEVTRNTRIQSWFYEPSFLVYAFMPVVFISLARLFKITNIITLKKALFIIIIFCLSRSAIGFLGIILSLLIIINFKYSFFKNPKIIITLLSFVLVIGFFLYKTPDIKFRVDDTVKLFFDKTVTGKDVDRINLSTYAFYSNYKVTIEALKQNPIFGTGLGTHEYNYDKYLEKIIPESNYRKYYKINRKDANSMFFRLLSETGLLGTFFLLFLIFKSRIKLIYSENITESKLIYWLINNGIFVLILLRFLRQGHYTMLGFTLFLLMYFYANKRLNERSKEIS
jgi:O-antigen ligase